MVDNTEQYAARDVCPQAILNDFRQSIVIAPTLSLVPRGGSPQTDAVWYKCTPLQWGSYVCTLREGGSLWIWCQCDPALKSEEIE